MDITVEAAIFNHIHNGTLKEHTPTKKKHREAAAQVNRIHRSAVEQVLKIVLEKKNIPGTLNLRPTRK